MPKNSIDRDGIPARYITVLLIGELLNVTTVLGDSLDLDVTDALILACVAFFSSNRGVNEAVERGELTTQNSGDYQIQHHPVNAKSIHLKLGMSRETVRRRLLYLASRDLIKKRDDGYFFPVQRGEDDVTGQLREFCIETATRLHTKLSPYVNQPD